MLFVGKSQVVYKPLLIFIHSDILSPIPLCKDIKKIYEFDKQFDRIF